MAGPKTILKVVEVQCNPRGIVACFGHIEVEDAIALIADGRIGAHFAQQVGNIIFDVKDTGSCYPNVDGYIVSGPHVWWVSQKTLTTHGVKFLLSSDVGGNRKSTAESRREAMAAVDRWVVVDLVLFPMMRVFWFRNDALKDELSGGELSSKTLAWNRPGFYRFVRKHDVLQVESRRVLEDRKKLCIKTVVGAVRRLEGRSLGCYVDQVCRDGERVACDRKNNKAKMTKMRDEELRRLGYI